MFTLHREHPRTLFCRNPGWQFWMRDNNGVDHCFSWRKRKPVQSSMRWSGCTSEGRRDPCGKSERATFVKMEAFASQYYRLFRISSGKVVAFPGEVSRWSRAHALRGKKWSRCFGVVLSLGLYMFRWVVVVWEDMCGVQFPEERNTLGRVFRADSVTYLQGMGASRNRNYRNQSGYHFWLLYIPRAKSDRISSIVDRASLLKTAIFSTW